jgi:hypothetical protein
MNKETLDKSITVASRFLAEARALRQAVELDGESIYGTRRSGAVKRASMDLTRALTDLRRPG